MCEIDLLSLYVNIFLDPLDQGSAGITPARYPLPGKGLVLHTARPVNKDRPSLAAFLGQSTIGGTCFEHPLYKDPISPGVSLEKEVQGCGTLDWTGQIPIMT